MSEKLASHPRGSVRLQRVNRANTQALALLRIGTGAFFTIFGEYKVFGAEFARSGFRQYVEEFVRTGAYPFMIPVLRWILMHAATPMAIAVGYGEFLIGISLLTGFLSRVASIFGFALMLAMWLSGGYPGGHAAFWMYWGASLNWSVFAICFAVLAVGRPEEVWSIRAMIRGKIGMGDLEHEKSSSEV
jgi:thiosulfate dehydrogenase (quinone) large subunit